jgi:hypothetical protein
MADKRENFDILGDDDVSSLVSQKDKETIAALMAKDSKAVPPRKSLPAISKRLPEYVLRRIQERTGSVEDGD